MDHSKSIPTKKIQTTVRPSVGTNGNLENHSLTPFQIKMGALVNQSHAKKLFGARLADKSLAKSYSELVNIFQYDSNENGYTSNF